MFLVEVFVICCGFKFGVMVMFVVKKGMSKIVFENRFKVFYVVCYFDG